MPPSPRVAAVTPSSRASTPEVLSGDPSIGHRLELLAQYNEVLSSQSCPSNPIKTEHASDLSARTTNEVLHAIPRKEISVEVIHREAWARFRYLKNGLKL